MIRVFDSPCNKISQHAKNNVLHLLAHGGLDTQEESI
jgi:hypothetical protein